MLVFIFSLIKFDFEIAEQMMLSPAGKNQTQEKTVLNWLGALEFILCPYLCTAF